MRCAVVLAAVLLAAGLHAGCSTTEGPDLPDFLQGSSSPSSLDLPGEYASSATGVSREAGAEGVQTAEELRAVLAERRVQGNRLWARAQAAPTDEERADLYDDLASDFPEHPQAAEARYRHGLHLYRAGEWMGAVESLKEYLSVAPVNPNLAQVEEMIFRSGAAYIEEDRGILNIFRDDGVGLDALRFVAATFPAGDYADDALLTLGRRFQQDGEHQRAMLYYKELLLRYPDSEWSFEARRSLGETYAQRDYGTPYHAGFVDRDPRERVPNDPKAEAHAGPVRSGLELALEQYDGYLERIRRDPARQGEYAQQVAQVEAERRRLREEAARKDERTAAWYAARGDARAAEVYRRSAANWRATTRGMPGAVTPRPAELVQPVPQPALVGTPTAPPAAPTVTPAPLPTTPRPAAPPVTRPPPPAVPAPVAWPPAPTARSSIPPPPASRMALRPLAACALLALVAALPACSGYSTERLTAFPAARSIAVEPFENLGFRRDLELRLTQAVAHEIRARTDLALAAPASADLVMSGRMRAEEVATALDTQGAPIEKQLTGWLEIVITDRRTGQVLRRGRAGATAEWRASVPGESLAGSATADWIRRLAEQAVHMLERDF